MWVWQSQAPAGTSKFTGVAGCEGFASAARFCMAIPAAIEASRRSRLLNMVVVSSIELFGWGGGIRALRSSLTGCARGKKRDDRGHQRTGGKKIKPSLEALGGILDPADDEGAEIAAEVADGIDQRDCTCRRGTRQEDR